MVLIPNNASFLFVLLPTYRRSATGSDHTFCLNSLLLVANGHKLYFYTHYNENKHRNDMEIDFIISNNSRLKYKMFPIEVKSGKQYKTTSLNNFREKYKERIGESYIIHPRNLIVKDGIICIPPYMTMNI